MKTENFTECGFTTLPTSWLHLHRCLRVNYLNWRHEL